MLIFLPAYWCDQRTRQEEVRGPVRGRASGAHRQVNFSRSTVNGTRVSALPYAPSQAPGQWNGPPVSVHMFYLSCEVEALLREPLGSAQV